MSELAAGDVPGGGLAFHLSKGPNGVAVSNYDYFYYKCLLIIYPIFYITLILVGSVPGL